MDNFIFDKSGNLTPAKISDVSLEDFVNFFEKNFKNSVTRKILCENFLQYVDDLSKILKEDSFEILIDGSFVTNKENPNDIDIVVVILNSTISNIDEGLLSNFRCTLLQRKLTHYQGVHAFIIEEFEHNHPKFLTYRADILHWIDFFSKSRTGDKKGILRLKL
jgi:hypothetical protein